MSRRLLFGAAVVILAAALGWRLSHRGSSDVVLASNVRPPEAAPVCPWREPENSLRAFFPEADHYNSETRSLSGARLQLADALGRALEPDENLLRFHRVYQGREPLGYVLTRRVKGANGAIEIVVAADGHGAVSGLRIQRMREPEAVAARLNDTEWLRSFNGMNDHSDWQLNGADGSLSAEARSARAAIADGVRSSLILLSAARQQFSGALVKSHH